MPTSNVGTSVLLDSQYGANLSVEGVLEVNGYIKSEDYIWANPKSNNVGIYNWGLTTTSTKAYSQVDSDSVEQILFNYDGSATFKGQVQTAGGTVSPAFVIQLEADNPDHYTKNGNELEPEYTGPTLDVKETLLTLLQKVEAMEARLASTDSVPED
jgi:hypothetical protein